MKSKIMIQKKIDNSYSVRPLDGDPVGGVIGKATYDQPFEVEITRTFNDSRESDTKLRNSIELMYLDHEKIAKQLSLRRSSMILKVDVPRKGAPVINQASKYVSIIYTYTIRYTEIIKEV